MLLQRPTSPHRTANCDDSELPPRTSRHDFASAPEGNSPPDFLLWQLADSAFPTGAFAHSAGLEAAWHHGELRNAGELESFLEASLLQVGHGYLPFMTAAYRDPAGLIELDQICDTFILNHVANRASRAQGRAYLATVRRIFGLSNFDMSRHGPPFFHLAPVSGFVMCSLEINFDCACSLFLFQSLRGLISSAVRLGVLGPLEGQTLQYRMASRAKELAFRCRALSISQITQVSPLLDLRQGTHDALYSRLFQS